MPTRTRRLEHHRPGRGFNHWLASFADAYVESGLLLKLREITLAYEVLQLRGPAVERQSRGSVQRQRTQPLHHHAYSTWGRGGRRCRNFANQPIYRNIEVTPYPSSRSFWTHRMSFY